MRIENFKKEDRSGIEQKANSQENPSLLLFSRLQNSEIMNQLISLYYNYFRYQGVDMNKEDIYFKIKERLNLAMKDTPITFNSDIESYAEKASIDDEGGDAFGRELMQVNLDTNSDAIVDKNNSQFIQSIIEAHEKGHFIRPFNDEYFDKYFQTGFDIDAMQYDIKKIRKAYDKAGIDYFFDSDEDLLRVLKNYLFSADEIAERMSQLKNYFGMSGNEEFTKEHLDYVKKNYVKDTGLDNNMNQFFSAITKYTEDTFLRIINNSGI